MGQVAAVEEHGIHGNGTNIDLAVSKQTVKPSTESTPPTSLLQRQPSGKKQLQERTIYLNYHEGANRVGKFVSNYVSTTHYTALNFFPLSLFNQFRRLANFYFLVIAILQSIPVISPLNPITSILPLICVVGVSMTRDAYEDHKRHRADKETNNQQVWALRKG